MLGAQEPVRDTGLEESVRAPVADLVPRPTGVVLVFTASGTRYRFDLAAGTVRRRLSQAGACSFGLRRDEEEVRLLGLSPVEIGFPLTMALDIRLDGTPTVRTTNEVVAVTVVDGTDAVGPEVEGARG